MQYTISENHIRTVIRSLLREGATPLLYHFLEPRRLLSLLRRNSFRLSNPERYTPAGADKKAYSDGKGQRYMSMTRNKNHKEGYPVLMLSGENHNWVDSVICRVTIDGAALNTYSNFKDKQGKQHHLSVKPTDYAYYDVGGGGSKERFMDDFGVEAQNGKEWMMKSNDEYINPQWEKDGISSADRGRELSGAMSDVYSHAYSQAEDRLTSDALFVPDAARYILGVDIYVREQSGDDMRASDMISDEEWPVLLQILRLCDKMGIAVHIYNDQAAFTKQETSRAIDAARLLYNHNKYQQLFGNQ